MSTRRMAKVNEAIRESIATEALFGLKDPRVKNVTVLRAEVSPDLRTAKVYVSVRGDEKTQLLTMHGLRSAKGYLQSKLADRLQTRYTPVLTFVLDQSVKITAQTSAVIDKAMRDSGLRPSSEDEIATDEIATDEAVEDDAFEEGEEDLDSADDLSEAADQDGIDALADDEVEDHEVEDERSHTDKPPTG